MLFFLLLEPRLRSRSIKTAVLRSGNGCKDDLSPPPPTLSLSLPHTHTQPSDLFLNLTPINLYGNHSNYSLNLSLYLVGTGLLNTVSLVFFPMNLAFKTFNLVYWIWGVLYRVYTKDMNDCLLGAPLITNPSLVNAPAENPPRSCSCARMRPLGNHGAMFV